MSQRISFHTLGCRLNQAETAAITRTFEQRQYDIVDRDADADIVVVNTCTVTENGDADTRRLVNRITRANPAAKIALIGCQAQVQASVLRQLPNVSWVVGNAHKMDLVEIVATEPVGDTFVDVAEIPTDSFTIPTAAIDRRHTRANLKIQDGCDFYCFFCVIPYTRGHARSRQFTDLLREAEELVAAGHRELVLTGVNIGTYADSDKQFIDVVDSLTAISGLDRLRISSIEPTTIPELLPQQMTADSVLCRHLHIPLQSGNDDVLYRMNRRYTIAAYTEFLLRAHEEVPELCLGTDVIVGYPGESDAHFEESAELLRQLPFAYFHVFSYSERERAKSQLFEEQVDGKVIAQRSRMLRELSSRKRRVFHERFIGRDVDVLFEQCRKGKWSGLTDNYIRVVVESDHELSNTIASVRLKEIDGQSIRGVLI
jgi:threonylcarbamoyladenosine tRNA methylthiotransferase MtaB